MDKTATKMLALTIDGTTYYGRTFGALGKRAKAAVGLDAWLSAVGPNCENILSVWVRA